MAKANKGFKKVEGRYRFEGEDVKRKMIVTYPAIGRELVYPVGQLSSYTHEGYTDEALDNGWKQRVGDFRAVDGDQSDRAKDQEAFDKAEDYLEHLLDGGDWKMTAGALTKTLIKALLQVEPKFTAEQLRAGAKHDPAQVKHWRNDARVKELMARWSFEKAQAAVKDAKIDGLVINLPQS